MRRMLIALAGLGLVGGAITMSQTEAALPIGARAPDFTTIGALGGKTFRLHLADQLKRRPVVLYFYPKAFTKGCTLEAHAFSEAMPEFRKAGAQVIGMSADSIGVLKKFSVEACRSAFPVATASPSIVRDYDVKMPLTGMTTRTSYVIGQDRRIVVVHSDMSWKDHVGRTLAAVRSLQRQ